ncbi:MAG: hypothetical protein V5A68_03910 [Candidatus Thermoplasmatota archaeon]
MGADKMTKGLQNIDSSINPTLSRGMTPTEKLKEESISNFDQPQKTRMLLNEASRDLHPYHYLSMVEPHLSSKLISDESLSKIKKLGRHFQDNITSFLIFETRLKSDEAKSDYCFAVSSRNGEREKLLNLLNNGHLPDAFLEKDEWKQLNNFVKSWAHPKSLLYNNVLGLWFEFDTASSIPRAPKPSIFIQPKSNYNITGDIHCQHKWITKKALPLLLGRSLPHTVEENILDCIKKLPLNSSLFQIGTMLSREDNDIRLVIKGIKPDEIISYLNSVGWTDDNKNRLSKLLDEIKDIVSRIVLHISVGEKVNPKVGIECSFDSNKYHKEQGWVRFLDYLSEKDLCNKEKYSSLLKYSGIYPKDHDEDFNSNKCIPSVMISQENYSKRSLIRYISHIKLIYRPNNNEIKAKAYPAVRLFGYPNDSKVKDSRLLK